MTNGISNGECMRNSFLIAFFVMPVLAVPQLGVTEGSDPGEHVAVNMSLCVKSW